MHRTVWSIVLVLAVFGLSCGRRAGAIEPRPAPAAGHPAAARPTARQSNTPELRGFGVVGTEWFTASQSFAAILGSSRGVTFGGGLSVTEGSGFLDVSAQRFSKDGSRAFVGADKQVFPLGIPATITVIPLDVTIGWRFRGLVRGLIPYAGVGYTRLRYEESSDFADAAENFKKSFNGFHVVGGTEFRVSRWIGLTGEVKWTWVGDALGKGGVSEAFDEKNLGGTSLALKLVIGR